MHTCQALLIASLFSGVIGGSCASTGRIVGPEATRYTIATPPLGERDTTGSAENTPETSERALSIPLNVVREIIVFSLRVVTTLLIATGDWLQYERDAGQARRNFSSKFTDRSCAQEYAGRCEGTSRK